MNKFMKYGNRAIAICSPFMVIAEILKGDYFHSTLYVAIAVSAFIDWNRFDD